MLSDEKLQPCLILMYSACSNMNKVIAVDRDDK